MKKSIRTVALILAAVMMILTFPVTAFATAEGSQGLEFTSNGDGTCKVSGIGSCTDTEIIIPSTSPEGDTVTQIGFMAFSNAKNVTAITIPDTVTSIKSGAFISCVQLLSIEIPASVTNIEAPVFEFCHQLASVTVDEENPKYHSAENCIIETESKTLVSGCTYSSIPSDGSVEIIGDHAFSYLGGITSISIPSSVVAIGSYAFSGMGLESIHIPAGVTSIVDNAFADCRNLSSITVAEGNTKYHSYKNCLIDTERKLLISGCKKSVLPDDGSVTAIGDVAFYGCEGLKKIDIPKEIESIGVFAFAHCTSLATIYYEGNKREWNSITKDRDWDLYVGEHTSKGTYEVSFDRCLYEHVHINSTVVEPTCTEDGYTALSCTACEYNVKTNAVFALGHSYNDSGVCTSCGDTVTPETTVTTETTTEEATTEEPATEESTTEATTESVSVEEVTIDVLPDTNGCGETVSITSLALVLAIASCAVLVSKKKEY